MVEKLFSGDDIIDLTHSPALTGHTSVLITGAYGFDGNDTIIGGLHANGGKGKDKYIYQTDTLTMNPWIQDFDFSEDEIHIPSKYKNKIVLSCCETMTVITSKDHANNMTITGLSSEVENTQDLKSSKFIQFL